MHLYRVRAHVHHYTEFMDASIFHDAAANITDIISEYNELGPILNVEPSIHGGIR
jgi:hypothetical protein